MISAITYALSSITLSRRRRSRSRSRPRRARSKRCAACNGMQIVGLPRRLLARRLELEAEHSAAARWHAETPREVAELLAHPHRGAADLQRPPIALDAVPNLHRDRHTLIVHNAMLRRHERVVRREAAVISKAYCGV